MDKYDKKLYLSFKKAAHTIDNWVLINPVTREPWLGEPEQPKIIGETKAKKKKVAIETTEVVRSLGDFVITNTGNIYQLGEPNEKYELILKEPEKDFIKKVRKRFKNSEKRILNMPLKRVKEVTTLNGLQKALQRLFGKK